MSKVTVEELDSLVSDLKARRVAKEQAEQIVTGINKDIMEIEAKIMAYLKELGREKFSAKDGTVSVSEKFYFKLPQTDPDKQKFFEHLKERGLFDKYATVHATAYNSYCNKEFEIAKEEGRALEFALPGVPEPTLQTKLSFRKS